MDQQSTPNTPVLEIQLKDLMLDPSNPRTGEMDKPAFKELKASIVAHGLINPLTIRLYDQVDQQPIYAVVAGARRYRALAELEAEGNWTGPVPVRMATLADATETALAENLMRVAMHPVDEHRAFAKLRLDGLSPRKIAKRFGVSERVVKQRLALGGMHATLMRAFREDRIDTVTAQILCQQADSLQRYFAERLDERGPKGEIEHHEVMSQVRQTTLHPTDTKAKFVGLEAYKARGGRITEDLFNSGMLLCDPQIVTRLYAEKQEELIAEWRAQGWKSVHWQGDPELQDSWRNTDYVPAVECQDLEAEERPNYTVALAVSYEGNLTASYRKVRAPVDYSRPGTGQVAGEGARDDSDADGEDTGRPYRVEEYARQLEPDNTAALSEDLSDRLTSAMRYAMLEPENEGKTIALLLAQLWMMGASVLGVRGWPLTFIGQAEPGQDLRPTLAGADGEPVDLSEYREVVGFFAGLNEANQRRYLCEATAAFFSVKDLRLWNASHGRCTNDKARAAVNLIDPHAHILRVFTPDSAYFGKLKMSQIVEALIEMEGEAACVANNWIRRADKTSTMRKPELAKVAERIAQKHGWLPKTLRAPGYGQPMEAQSPALRAWLRSDAPIAALPAPAEVVEDAELVEDAIALSPLTHQMTPVPGSLAALIAEAEAMPDEPEGPIDPPAEDSPIIEPDEGEPVAAPARRRASGGRRSGRARSKLAAAE